MFGKYSFINMLKVYKENHQLINAQLQGKTIEGLNGEDGATKWLGLGVAMFMILLLIGAAIWLWAIVLTIKYWKDLSDLARVFVILTLLVPQFGGPVITIIIIYATKGSGRSAKPIMGGGVGDSGYNFRFR